MKKRKKTPTLAMRKKKYEFNGKLSEKNAKIDELLKRIGELEEVQSNKRKKA